MLLKIRFIKFAGVGLLNTIVGYTIYSALLYAKFGYPLASLISLILGIFFNYLTTSQLVFRERTTNRFFRYFITYIFVYFFNLAILWILVDIMNISAYLSGIVALPFNVVVTFWLLNRFVFQSNGHPT